MKCVFKLNIYFLFSFFYFFLFPQMLAYDREYNLDTQFTENK